MLGSVCWALGLQIVWTSLGWDVVGLCNTRERPTTVGSFPCWRATLLLPGCVVGSFAPPRRPLCCLSPANATEGPHSAPLNAAPHYKGAAGFRARSKGAATDELMALIIV